MIIRKSLIQCLTLLRSQIRLNSEEPIYLKLKVYAYLGIKR